MRLSLMLTSTIALLAACSCVELRLRTHSPAQVCVQLLFLTSAAPIVF